jgi:hypothetical protein
MSAKLQTGKTVKKKTELTGRSPLRRRKSALVCSGIEEEEEEEEERRRKSLLQHFPAQKPTAITRENCIYTTLIIAHCLYTRLGSQLIISCETYDGTKSYYKQTYYARNRKET